MTTVTEQKWVEPSAVERLKILQDTQPIAIVCASDKLERASYFVATYLLSSSTYDVYFVNPILAGKGGTILGHKVYPSLQDIPVKIDLVDVFRRPEDTPRSEERRVGKEYRSRCTRRPYRRCGYIKSI